MDDRLPNHCVQVWSMSLQLPKNGKTVNEVLHRAGKPSSSRAHTAQFRGIPSKLRFSQPEKRNMEWTRKNKKRQEKCRKSLANETKALSCYCFHVVVLGTKYGIHSTNALAWATLGLIADDRLATTPIHMQKIYAKYLQNICMEPCAERAFCPVILRKCSRNGAILYLHNLVQSISLSEGTRGSSFKISSGQLRRRCSITRFIGRRHFSGRLQLKIITINIPSLSVRLLQ